MNKAKLEKFVYILLRERLTFGDLEAILGEVESSNAPDLSPVIQLYVEETVNRLLASGLKCAENMCNTQDDDVRMVKRQVYYKGETVAEDVALCADCRKRNPETVLL